MKKLTLMMTALGLVACAPVNNAQRTAILKPNVITYDVPSVHIYETRLADGTRCVYMSSSHGKAVTCEWKPVVVISQVQ